MKRSALLVSAISLVACATTTPSTNVPTERCESTECFNQQQIRDFEVVDNTTLVVYVGSQNCAFRVEFTGTFCDLTFLPGSQLVFRPDSFRSAREPDNLLLTRVCARDSNLGIDEGPFSSAAGATDVDRRNPCRVSDIVSITDDELLELYVDKRITIPPPPFGTGQIELPDASESSIGDDAEEGSDSTTPAEAPPDQVPPTAAN
jgi:hypothetical protein